MRPGSPSSSDAVQRAESVLRALTLHQASRSPGLPQQPIIKNAQRNTALQPPPLRSIVCRSQDGLLPRTRAQLPLWYITLRQVVLDAYRAVAVVYRVANHVLGSLFEVSPLPYIHITRVYRAKPAAEQYTPDGTAIRSHCAQRWWLCPACG